MFSKNHDIRKMFEKMNNKNLSNKPNTSDHDFSFQESIDDSLPEEVVSVWQNSRRQTGIGM